MFVFLEYKTWDLAIEKISQDLDLDFLHVFKSNILPVKRIKIENYLEIVDVFQSQDIFSDTATENYLVDVQNSILDKKAKEGLENYINETNRVYLYSSTKEALTAEEKKLFKDIGKIEKLTKLNDAFKTSLVDSYNLNLDANTVDKIIKYSKDYRQVENILDLIELSGEIEKVIETNLPEEELPIFMTSFNLDNLDRDLPKWLNKIKEEDVQLGLSLIFGKLEKQLQKPGVETLINHLVKTDLLMKTRGGVSPLLWWKLFLWKARTLT